MVSRNLREEEASMSNEVRNYKDTLFRLIFKDKENLLSLYNAINHTNYENAEELQVTTLEDAVYMNMKNDLSFVLDCSLSLYEHQSTLNPNMPLRNLFYVSKVLQGITSKDDLYSSKMIQIPTPKFIVFYNGVDIKPDYWEYQLSDMYEQRREDCDLELKVCVYNINQGMNQDLLNACQTLKEYAIYVGKLREYMATMPFEDAVEKTVDECIKEAVLADFLSRHRAEVKEVSWYEYNEEQHIKNEREIAMEEMLERINLLTIKLSEDGRADDILRAAKDKEYQQQLLQEYHL